MRMEKVVLCPACGDEHIVSQTVDPAGNGVGFFCTTRRVMVEVTSPMWNGVNIAQLTEKFAQRNVKKGTLSRLSDEKLYGLAKKLAYLFLETSEVKDKRVNYYFALYHTHRAVLALKEKATV
jgi:hypothetical protein